MFTPLVDLRISTLLNRIVAFLFLLAVSTTSAQRGMPPNEPMSFGTDYVSVTPIIGSVMEWNKKLEPSLDLQLHDVGLLGDTIDLHTGALSFLHTDIVLPGNSTLEVALHREKYPGLQSGGNREFGDWYYAVPRINAVTAKQSPWDGARCTDLQNKFTTAHDEPGRDGLTIDGPAPKTALGREYSEGIILSVPGQTKTPLLVPSAVSVTPSEAEYVTQDNWYLICTTSANHGEGFIAYSPTGETYIFNHAVTYGHPNMGYPSPMGPVDTYTGLNIPRENQQIFATQVTDRHGNWVKYDYNSDGNLTRIHANDGRSIELAYDSTGADESNLVTSITANGRTWVYSYETAFVPGPSEFGTAQLRKTLSKVELPDGSFWSMALDMTLQETKPGFHCRNGEGLATITHPTGVTGIFKLAEIEHRLGQRTDIQFSSCFPVFNGYHTGLPQAEDVYPAVIETMAVTEKVLSGPNYPQREWTYTYEQDVNWPRDASGLPAVGSTSDPTNWTVVVDPTGVQTTYKHFWSDVGSQGGKLASEEVRSSVDGPLIQRKRYTYVPVGPAGQNAIPGFAPVMPLAQRMPAALSLVESTLFSSDGTDKYSKEYSYRSHYSDIDFSFGFPVAESHWSNFDGSDQPRRTIETVYEHDRTAWHLGLPKEVRYNGKKVHDYVFDDKGQLIEHTQFDRRTDYQYHTSVGQQGALKSATVSSLNNNVSRTTEFDNYKRGIAQSVKRPDNRRVTASVDNNGWVISSTTAKGATTHYGYNSVGWVTLVNRPFPLSDTSLHYSQVGHGTVKTMTTGDKKTVVRHNGFNQPVNVESYDLSSGNVIYSKKEYDALGRVIFESQPAFDTNPSNGVTTTYDAIGRVVEKAEHINNQKVGITTTRYQARNKTRITNPLNNATTFTRSGYSDPNDGNILKIEEPLGVTTEMSYDIYGNILTARQYGQSSFGADETQRWSYDDNLRLCRHHSPETGAKLFRINAFDELVAYAEGQSGYHGCGGIPSSKKVSLFYDSLGQHEETRYPDSTITKTYDASGNLKSISRGAAVWTYHYNNVDQLLTETLSIDNKAFVTGYSYNDDNLSAITYPSGRTVSFNPNGFGQPTVARSQSGALYASNLSYHANDILASMVRGNGRSLTQQLNAHQNVSQISHQGGFTWNYSYDAAHRITQISDSGSFSRIFHYDALDRLIKAEAPNQWGVASYSYDGLNNIRARNYSGRNVIIHYNTLNQVQRYTDNTSQFSFAHDARGNVLSDGRYNFVYDYANQPTSMVGINEHNQAINASFTYDGHLKRVKQSINNNIIYSVYTKSGDLIHRHDAATNTATDYLKVGPHVIAEVEQKGGVDTLRYPYFDHLGSPIKIGLSDGSTPGAEQTTYMPYGDTWGAAGQRANQRGFTGHIDDSATGLTYMQARYYNPVIGRFYSNDPVSFTESGFDPEYFNRYAYVGNNPVTTVDPDGEFGALGAIIGAVSEGLMEAGSQLASGGITDLGAIGEAALEGAILAAVVPGAAAGSIGRLLNTAKRLKTKPKAGGVTKKALPEHTKHSLNQKINREVKTSDELDAIRNPLDKRPVKYDSQGRPSQRYVGEKAEVAINPDTNKIVSVNPTSSKKAARLKRRNERNK